MTRSATRWAVFGFTMLVAAGTTAIAIAWYQREHHTTWLTDAQSIRRPIAEAEARDILWRPPLDLPEAINGASGEFEPAVSPDGLSLFFARGQPARGTDLYVCTLLTGGWSSPEALAAVNSDADELGAAVAPDGAIYFASNRSGGLGGYDLWVARRLDSGWEAPRNLGPAINSPQDDVAPGLAPDGTILYFASNRPGPPAPGAANHQTDDSDYDLFLVAVLDPGSAASAIPELNTPWHESGPAVSPAGDFVYFASDRPGGAGAFDLYRSRRLGAEHTAPRALGEPINTAGDEIDPALSLDGFGLHFAAPGPNGDYDLRHTTSREVFAQVESHRATIDWAALLAAIWPYLAWVAATAALLLFLARLLSRLEYRRLSLLARCLLASLVIHAILMVSLGFWGITASYAPWTRPGRGTRVLLVAPSVGAGMAAQVRGPSTNVMMEAAALPASARRVAADVVPIAAAARPEPVSEPQPSPLDDAPDASVLRPLREAPAPAGERPMPAPAPGPPPAPSADAVRVPGTEAPATRPETAASVRVPSAVVAGRPAEDARTLVAVAERPDDAASLPPSELGADVSESRPAEPAPRRGAPVPTTPTPRAAAVPARAQVPLDVRLPEAVAQAAGEAAAAEAPAPPQAVAGAKASSLELLDVVSSAAAQVEIDPGIAGVAGAAAESAIPVQARDAVAAAPQAPPRAAPALAALELPVAVPRSAAQAGQPAPAAPADQAVLAANSAPRRPLSLPVPAAAPRAQVEIDPAPGSVVSRDERLSLPPPRDARASDPEAPGRPAVPILTAAIDLALPDASGPSLYPQRDPERRPEILKEMGGSAETEHAVALALDWLARHQGNDGGWNGNHYDEGCGACPGEQRVKCDVALTGLSLLCFLAADHSPGRPGRYRAVAERGVEWLLARQAPDGSVLEDESMYSHGIAVIALSEAYAMTRDERLRAPIESGVRFIHDARNLYTGGWRYRPGQVGDTSVLGWQVMALTSARRAGIEVPEASFDTARQWLEVVHRSSRPGQYAYQPQREVTPAMTAEGLFASQLLGAPRDGPRTAGSIAFILDNEPAWQPDANTYYWDYATLSLFNHQGPEWDRWNEAIKELLVSRQRADGPAAGSFDPDGRWAGVAGRVYQTAIATLTLEVYYRYLPLFAEEGTEARRHEGTK